MDLGRLAITQTPVKKTVLAEWNMKVKVIPIIVGALGTTPEDLVNGLEDLEIRREVQTI